MQKYFFIQQFFTGFEHAIFINNRCYAICIPLFKLISGVMRLKVGKFQASREYKDLIQQIFLGSFSWRSFVKDDNGDTTDVIGKLNVFFRL